MKQLHILLGDDDSSYIDALVEFLMGSRDRMLIHSYTDTELFLEDMILLEKGEYDIAVLSGEYIRVLKDEDFLDDFLGKVPGVLQLVGDEHEEVYLPETLLKYQAMDGLLQEIERFYYVPKAILQERRQFEAAGGKGVLTVPEKEDVLIGGAGIRNRQADNQNTGDRSLDSQNMSDQYISDQYTAVYSPVHHELMLPAALLFAEQSASENGVIVVDMEENTRLYELLGRKNRYSLSDYLYLRQQDDISLDEVLMHDGKLSYLPVVSCPMELGSITEEQWQVLLADLKERKESVVFIFGNLHQGAGKMLDLCSRLLLVERKEKVYRSMQDKNCEMLLKWKPHLQIKEAGLGLTVGSETSSAWNMEDLKNSNLAVYIKTHLQEWMVWNSK